MEACSRYSHVSGNGRSGFAYAHRRTGERDARPFSTAYIVVYRSKGREYEFSFFFHPPIRAATNVSSGSVIRLKNQRAMEWRKTPPTDGDCGNAAGQEACSTPCVCKKPRPTQPSLAKRYSARSTFENERHHWVFDPHGDASYSPVGKRIGVPAQQHPQLIQNEAVWHKAGQPRQGGARGDRIQYVGSK